ncbi:hypothetical protein KRR40_08430 [Niabella defluvii]|nr:hypothetical protein KRR40_08430 [Niabella sp. I65]
MYKVNGKIFLLMGMDSNHSLLM